MESVFVNFDQNPRLLVAIKDAFSSNLSAKKSTTPHSNYLKGVIWSPTGASLLTASADKIFRVFQTNEHGGDEDCCKLHIKEGEMIYDFCWFPYADETNAQTHCFLSTSRSQPIHLWDASLGTLRASYRCYNAQDEVTACTSVGISSDGRYIYGGSKNAVYVFDIAVPGREYSYVQTFTKQDGGVQGLISTLAFSVVDPRIYAIGSYSGKIGIYSTEDHTIHLLLNGHTNGVTKVLFSGDSYYLYSGARCDPYILCWDIRNTASALFKLSRSSASTNQRIYFDIEPQSGRHLVSGSETGSLQIFDLTVGQLRTQYPITTDVLNGVHFHPHHPWIATSSGQRHYPSIKGHTQFDSSLGIYAFSFD